MSFISRIKIGNNEPVDIKDENLTGVVEAINSKIPSAASSANKLADKAYVDTSIATNSANFLGTSASCLTEQQFLAWADTLSPSTNDYVFWNTLDGQNNAIFKRYRYNGTTWLYEWELARNMFVLITESDYEALVEAGTVNPSIVYMLYEPEEEV